MRPGTSAVVPGTVHRGNDDDHDKPTADDIGAIGAQLREGVFE
jgi:hypothetical protein